MDKLKIVRITKTVLGVAFFLAGGWLLINPTNAANFFCQHKQILAILMMAGGALLFYQRKN